MKIISRLAATLALVCAAFAFQTSLARAYTLTVVDGIDVKDWDPAIAYGHESYVLNNIYDPLTRYNTKEGKLEPRVASIIVFRGIGRRANYGVVATRSA